MPKDRLYVTYFGGADGLDSDEDTRQFWLDMGYVLNHTFMYLVRLNSRAILVH